MVAIQAVIGLLALMATAPAVHGHVVQSAPARRDLLPNIPAVTPLARLQVRQGGGGGGGGDDSQRQQQQAQQQIQQISQSFQERVDQLNSQLQSVQQSAQRSADDVRRSADGVRSSADSVIGSIRASADSAVGEANARASDAAQKASDAAANAQSVAAAAPSPAAANVDGGDGPAGVTATVTATAVTTVTATVRVNVVANGDVGGDGPSAVELPVATCLAPLQVCPPCTRVAQQMLTANAVQQRWTDHHPDAGLRRLRHARQGAGHCGCRPRRHRHLGPRLRSLHVLPAPEVLLGFGKQHRRRPLPRDDL